MGKQSSETSFLAGHNAAFLTQLYAQFLQDPQSVDSSWAEVFQRLGDDAVSLLEEMHGATWGEHEEIPIEALPQTEITQQNTLDSIRALMLIRSYRVRGHLQAKLDPLGLVKPADHTELDPASYGFKPQDYDREIFINGYLGLQSATLQEICNVLDQTYAASIGVEYMHIQDPYQKSWIQERIENFATRYHFSVEEKLEILDSLTRAETFEKF